MSPRNQSDLPAAWIADEAWEVEGSNIVDKSRLVDVPFFITALSFRISASDVQIVYVDIEQIDGTTATFTDASTGVRAQLDAMWHAKTGEEPNYTTTEEWCKARIIVRNGLRVSEYLPEGRREKARTYYLTSNGQRRTTEPGQAASATPTTAPVPSRQARSRSKA